MADTRQKYAQLACPEGIEPPTHSLEGCCSIQLSYGQLYEKRPRKEPFFVVGRGDRIRTYDPLVPNQMRYQTALRPDTDILPAANTSLGRLVKICTLLH